MDLMSKSVILTGIRSNEEPTIANYLAAFLPIVNMQREFAGQYQINMFVPDLHSFTTPINHDQLYGNTIKNLKYFIAAGLNINDPDTFVYRQSYISAHSELTWILDCFTGFGEMERMTQFKDKSKYFEINDVIQSFLANNQGNVDVELLSKFTKELLSMQKERRDEVSVGLFNYPVLMAADILLYGAKHVPVGEDQFQHIEITRDIAARFNNKFGEIFTIPDATKDQMNFIKRDNGLRIRSLTDPTKKMSKSSDDPKSKILLSDTPDEAIKKIMNATTDSIGQVNFDWDNQPGITSLLQILAMTTGQTQSDVNAQWQGNTMYGEFKKAVAEAVAAFLTDFQTRLNAISDDELMNKLQTSEAAMSEVANATLLRAQQAVGLRPRTN
jgi:tryptophanyl-tRNA synthetase